MIENRFQELQTRPDFFSRDHSLSIAQALNEDFKNLIPIELQYDLFNRIELAHESYRTNDNLGKNRTSAFLVHPRDSQASIDQGMYYGDADGVFPALSYISSENVQHNKHLQKQKIALLNSLPPFEAATTVTQGIDGSPLHGSIVCIPLDIDKMLELPSATARLNGYARPLIQDATNFVLNKLGTQNIGLGEQLAAMTQFGQWLEKKFGNEIYTTTGHAGTIFAMAETLKLGAQKLGIDLSQETVGIIGCGRIGSAFAQYIEAQHITNNLMLYDNAPGVAEKVSADLIKNRLKQNGHKVAVAHNYEEILERTNLIISAVSDPLLGELSLDNHFVVDDSQPPWVPPQDTTGIIAWPSYSVPGHVQRNGIRMINGNITEEVDGFNYGPVGLLPHTDWGCNVELTSLVMSGRMKENHISRAASHEDVAEIGALIKQAGFSVNKLQSWGNFIPEKSFTQLRSNI